MFSNRGSTQFDQRAALDPYSGSEASHAPVDEETPPGKRLRVADWPLPLPATHARSGRVPSRTRLAPNSPSARRPRSQARPSRFVEGSMNDRASQQPPPDYLDREEELVREKFDLEQGEQTHPRATKSRVASRHGNSVSDTSTEASETSRASTSIFRFGRSLAASFNPSNWKIWSKQPQQSDQETTEQKILRERRERAEQAYQELKSAGHFRGHSTVTSPGVHKQKERMRSRSKNASLPVMGNSPTEDSQPRRGLLEDEMKKGRTSRPPRFPYSALSGSTASILSPTNDPFNDSPFTNQPNGYGARSVSGAQAKRDFSDRSEAQEFERHKPLRRLPSRKELEKQQKLVKRVSNLEAKLDLARRELARTIRQQCSVQIDQPDVINFTSGAVASLPSEQVLSNYLSTENSLTNGPVSPAIGWALSTDQKKDTYEACQSGIMSSEAAKDRVSDLRNNVTSSIETSPSEFPSMQKAMEERKRITKLAQEIDTYELVESDDSPDIAVPSTWNVRLEDPCEGRHKLHGQSDFTPEVTSRAVENQDKGEQDTERRSKLQKAIGDHTKPSSYLADAQQCKPGKGLRSGSPTLRDEVHSIEKSPAVSKTRKSGKLTKNKLSRRRSASSLPSSSCPEYDKPKNQPLQPTLAGNEKTNQFDQATIASKDIPPVPKIPKAVRLASGEIVRTSLESSRHARLPSVPVLKHKRDTMEGTNHNNEPFEWPEDVF